MKTKSIFHAGIGIEGEILITVIISQSFFELDIKRNIDSALN